MEDRLCATMDLEVRGAAPNTFHRTLEYLSAFPTARKSFSAVLIAAAAARGDIDSLSDVVVGGDGGGVVIAAATCLHFYRCCKCLLRARRSYATIESFATLRRFCTGSFDYICSPLPIQFLAAKNLTAGDDGCDQCRAVPWGLGTCSASSTGTGATPWPSTAGRTSATRSYDA